MAITKEQAQRYCEPFLQRKQFRFSQLNGMLSEPVRRSLAVARAFSDPKGDQVRFLATLRRAPPSLQEGIMGEANHPADCPNSAERSDLIARIQKCLVAHGVYAEFRRPASVGVILAQRDMDGLPVYFLLNEPVPKSRDFAYCGRTTFDPLDQRRPTSQVIYVPAAAARLAETLDMWMGDVKDPQSIESLDRRAIRISQSCLKGWCSKVNGGLNGPEDSIVRFALFVMSVRCGIKRLSGVLNDSDSPQDFIIRALNIQLDSVVAHETAHLLERKANGSMMIDKDGKELIAYLLEARYSYADIAFLSFLHRYRNDLDRLVPRFTKDMRERGAMAMLEGEDYLRNWAAEMLDNDFMQLTGRLPEDLMDVSLLKIVQTSDFMSQKHLPMLERAFYNPSATA